MPLLFPSASRSFFFVKVRILAAVTAVLLAVIGVAVLTNYVANADQRALKGAQAVQVYIVRSRIPAGTAADKLPQLVAEQALPANAVALGAITNLSQLAGRVPSTDLLPGEQLLNSRFVNPDSLKDKNAGQVPLPDGMQEVTIQLEPQRVVGGQLAPGDTVGVLFSFGQGPAGGPVGPVTHMEMQKVLVLTVQGVPAANAPSTGNGQAGSVPAVPAGTVLVTLARTAPDVEKIVYAAENGKIWLSREPSTASENGARVLNRDGVFK
jgi:pilus assembly protein CpaB